MKNGLILLSSLLFISTQLNGAYIPVYTSAANGGVTFTGNTLGLNKIAGQNAPGTTGSIGAFTTTDPNQVVTTFPSLFTGAGSPAGTTLNYILNNSSANLVLPMGSTILHAELIWSGSYGFDPTLPNTIALSASVNLTSPDLITHSIPPKPSVSAAPTLLDPGYTAQVDISRAFNPSTPSIPEAGFYVCSQDVTSYVTGSGTYTVGGVPGTAIASENNSNCAGWTLAVAFSNPSMLTSYLSIYAACEHSGNPALSIGNFRTPSTGAFSSRIFISALEGDTGITGDELRINNVAISGVNNLLNNFFASQINTIPLSAYSNDSNGKLIVSGSAPRDTTGTYGENNSNPPVNVSGGRQGYDITSIPITLANGAESLTAQGTTSGDGYTINAFAVQVQEAAPIIVNSTSQTLFSTTGGTLTNVHLNDVITYTSSFTNNGEGTATSVVFDDFLPFGLTLEPGTVTIDNVPSADSIVGVPLNDLFFWNHNHSRFQRKSHSY